MASLKLKGIVHPNIFSPHFVPNLYEFLLWNKKKIYFVLSGVHTMKVNWVQCCFGMAKTLFKIFYFVLHRRHKVNKWGELCI